jgi:hypothetical protein
MKELSTDLGGAAWKVEDPTMGHAMWGTTQTSGSERDVNPYRSELQGIHALLLAVTAVCKFCNITDGKITVGCDNLGGIKRSAADWLKINQSTKHADLIRAIRRLKDSLPITIHFVHIDGHQDRQTAFENLPRLAQLNVEMDHRAKERLRALIDSSAPPLPAAHLHKEGWRCTINGVKITSDPARAIRRAVFGKRLQTHLHQRNILDSTAFHDVDWDAIELASESFPPLYRLWMSKHVSGFFGIGKMMKHWNFWTHQKCPCCHHVKEDKHHLLTCPEPSCVAKWADSVHGLQEWLQEVDTAPDIQHCIISALSARTIDQSFQEVSHELSLPAALAQDRIGWVAFTEGRISTLWRKRQAAHYHAVHSERSVGKWAAGLVTSLLSVTHSQWVHRNSILHARDAHGIRVTRGQELETAIDLQFQSGLEGLHPRDYHLIERGQERVCRMTSTGQLSWLSSIRIARETFMAQSAKEAASMRTFMENHFKPT